MDNAKMPPVQPPQQFQPAGTPPVMGAGQTVGGVPTGAVPVMPAGQMGGVPSMPTPIAMAGGGVPTAPAAPSKKHDIVSLIKTIAIVVLSLIAVTFIGLFIWMYVQYDETSTTMNEQIEIAVAEAKDEQATKMEEEFLQREKYPYQIFSGPADYGQLTFEYPKTWSVYVEKAADKGGDFKAYFNPVQVDAVGKETINALRVTISTESYDEVVADYQKKLERRDSGLTVQSVEIGDAKKNSRTTANRYTGTIPDTDLSGFIVIFKIRDKTVILQTDSVLFQEDFDKMLETIVFNA